MLQVCMTHSLRCSVCFLRNHKSIVQNLRKAFVCPCICQTSCRSSRTNSFTFHPNRKCSFRLNQMSSQHRSVCATINRIRGVAIFVRNVDCAFFACTAKRNAKWSARRILPKPPVDALNSLCRVSY